MATHVLNVDLAKVYPSPTGRKVLQMLMWGEPLTLLEEVEGGLRIHYVRRVEDSDGSIVHREEEGYLKRQSGAPLDSILRPVEQDTLLRVHFVDVQQGDATLIETAGGRKMLVDGGENQLFARYLASRYRSSTAAAPVVFDAVVVTHGDADHFTGLRELSRSEGHSVEHKRIFAAARRVYHNGIVKRPSSLPELQQLGETVVSGRTWLTDLVDDPRQRRADANTPFQAWCEVLDQWQSRVPDLTVRRLEEGADQAFDFLAPDGVSVAVLGPHTSGVQGRIALPFLHEPPKGPVKTPVNGGSRSASHTINGHSVVLALRYGDVRLLLAGDLNQEAEEGLVERRRADLAAHVLKVPHHGSADFSDDFLEAVQPLISVVSSGDESARKEYVHPRASLLAALGRHGRPDGAVFVTELSAFFSAMGYVGKPWHIAAPDAPPGADDRMVVNLSEQDRFFAFKREAFGLIRVHTDGHRVLVVADSALTDMKEAYAYEVDAAGVPAPVEVRQI